MMKVNFLDLKAQYLSIKSEIDSSLQEVINSTAFSGGPFVKNFEANFAKVQHAKYCVGVNSGTAALNVALMALGIKQGDEVLVPANTFFATPEAVSLCGATPVFMDINKKYYTIDIAQIEEKITPKTKAIIAVNLYGQPAQLDKIKGIADKHHIILLEDCAQSHLATLNNKFTGTYGIAGCFSFYPGKNLGAYGEAGAVITDDESLYHKMMAMKDHGSSQKYHHDYIGNNYRMEGFQGAVLDVKLRYIDQWTATRRENADLYRKYLREVSEIVLPEEMNGAKHVYHIFAIRSKKRDELQAYLHKNEIFTGIHYPVPCHLQKAYAFLNYQKGSIPVSEQYANEVLSLPMSEQLTEKEIIYVAEKIKDFYAR